MSISRAKFYKRYLEETPLHRFLGVNIENLGENKSLVSVPINSNTLNMVGSLHGGVIYVVSDVAALAALGPSLSESQFALTINIQCSIYKGTTIGPVIFRGHVVSRSRRLAFINVEVTDGNGNLVAESRLCKAITNSIPPSFAQAEDGAL